MDSSTVSNKQRASTTASTPSTRNRADQNYARQLAADETARQQSRAANNRTAARRRAHSAFEQSIEQDRTLQRNNERAGVEKMVRSVVRKESVETEQNRSRDTSRRHDADAQVEYVREKLNTAYSNADPGSPRDENLRPSPSERQQQRAVENYQQSNRNTIDRTVELVV